MNLKNLFSPFPKPVLDRLDRVDFDLGARDGTTEGEVVAYLNRTVLMGGKRLRPLLVFLVADFLGVELTRAEPLALAIERVHAASLAHDDVIDEACERRGRPTLNAVTSNKLAVLGGDYLLSEVIFDLCSRGADYIPAVQKLSRVIKDLSAGEWLQMRLPGKARIDFSMVEEVAMKKTASVMGFCCEAPALLVGGHERAALAEKLKRVGELLGLAFQFTDDVLDMRSPESAEKSSLRDIEEGVLSSVCFEWFKDEGQVSLSLAQVRELQKMGFEELKNFLGADRLGAAISGVEARTAAHIEEAMGLLREVHEQHLGAAREKKLQNLFYLAELIKKRKS